MTKTGQNKMEAEVVDVVVQQVREQMFSGKMTYSRRSSSSNNCTRVGIQSRTLLVLFSDNHLQLFVLYSILIRHVTWTHKSPNQNHISF